MAKISELPGYHVETLYLNASEALGNKFEPLVL